MRSKFRLVAELVGPLAAVAIVTVYGSTMSIAQQGNVTNILVTATIVVALYVFTGNSGVMSFGQVSFVAVGAFAAGILTSPTLSRQANMPSLFKFLGTTQISNFDSLLLGAGLGALFALLVGVVLLRLSGLSAGIATFAVLEITYDVLSYWDKIGPGVMPVVLVPVTTTLVMGALGLGVAIAVAFAYQRTRSCRLLRATREDAVAAQGIGISIFQHRLIAFTISGAIAGFAGALFVHELGSISTGQVYIDLTFATLAMLVVGGTGSLWGAVLGGIALGVLETFLSNAENGVAIGSLHVTLPNGLSVVIVGVIMVVVLIFAPKGISGSHEFLERFFSDRPAKTGTGTESESTAKMPDEEPPEVPLSPRPTS
jgi:branched-chain amino acid transport system permease protein